MSAKELAKSIRAMLKQAGYTPAKATAGGYAMGNHTTGYIPGYRVIVLNKELVQLSHETGTPWPFDMINQIERRQQIELVLKGYQAALSGKYQVVHHSNEDRRPVLRVRIGG